MRRCLMMGLFAGLLASGRTTPLHSQAAHAPKGPYTPAVGSAERKAIFDAMRKLGDDHTRVFVVKYLMVQDGWAWLSVDPQSPDGVSHFEPESALEHYENGAWKVVDQPCGEEGCDSGAELIRIRRTYPSAPAAIFPTQQQ